MTLAKYGSSTRHLKTGKVIFTYEEGLIALENIAPKVSRGELLASIAQTWLFGKSVDGWLLCSKILIVSSLPIAGTEALGQLLNMLKEQRGKTVDVIEHRLYYLMALMDRFLYMAHGSIQRRGYDRRVSSLLKLGRHRKQRGERSNDQRI